ncbi:URC4/urg3 family protein [Halomicronema sp. CCY15110]|uniref:URC4/urg3 family protein n=1 Tax=Halomicronema sp. CCY15110 TaxID=2767773 RepID=UPI00194FBB7A|nr:URC4/urg3 family protein [Halomicronema sp. CCY15110]
MTPSESAAIAYLRTPQAIRDRCQQLFTLCETGKLEHFACDLSQLDAVAAYVVETTQQFYPDFEVPFHSRWRHFDAGGTPRLAQLDEMLTGMSRPEAARSRLDLAIVSVLLDAGAGSQWRYHDRVADQVLGRSEGLAIASLHAFQQGVFSSDPDQPYQVDAAGLQALTETDLANAFQVSDDNPLVGLSGRLQLLHQLGHTLAAQPQRFGTNFARPGNLLDYWQTTYGATLDAGHLLTEVLVSFGDIWPGRVAIAATNLGDVWPHAALPDTAPGKNLVPFHKLSQWLTYSLVEPLQSAGLTVTNLNALTGLAEYRNGGLCVDLGLLLPKHAAVTREAHSPSSPVVLEWRALTVVMLDRIGDRVRQQLGKSPDELPLIKVLEGGTWAAGRRTAKHRRPDGSPPITIHSDGTVF